jgi:23S rRNA (cytosine1962-C5)-methyltransferase
MGKVIALPWFDYEVIDSGDKKKLERFGKVILIRPEGSAIWKPNLPLSQWENLSYGEFVEEKSLKGKWIIKKGIPHNWIIKYPLGDHFLHFSLKLTRFKHVGVFPEQSVNWQYLYGKHNKNVLNLFAHTGGASQAASFRGSQVTHIDSVYSMVGWARSNGEMAETENIKWICEDSVDFVSKEIRRKRKYDLVILDPPSFGQSKKGKTWKIERDLAPLMGNIKKIMNIKGEIILNCYSKRMGESLLTELLYYFFNPSEITLYHHVFMDNFDRELECGILARIKLL